MYNEGIYFVLKDIRSCEKKNNLFEGTKSVLEMRDQFCCFAVCPKKGCALITLHFTMGLIWGLRANKSPWITEGIKCNSPPSFDVRQHMKQGARSDVQIQNTNKAKSVSASTAGVRDKIPFNAANAWQMMGNKGGTNKEKSASCLGTASHPVWK